MPPPVSRMHSFTPYRRPLIADFALISFISHHLVRSRTSCGVLFSQVEGSKRKVPSETRLRLHYAVRGLADKTPVFPFRSSANLHSSSSHPSARFWYSHHSLNSTHSAPSHSSLTAADLLCPVSHQRQLSASLSCRPPLRPLQQVIGPSGEARCPSRLVLDAVAPCSHRWIQLAPSEATALPRP